METCADASRRANHLALRVLSSEHMRAEGRRFQEVLKLRKLFEGRFASNGCTSGRHSAEAAQGQLRTSPDWIAQGLSGLRSRGNRLSGVTSDAQLHIMAMQG